MRALALMLLLAVPAQAQMVIPDEYGTADEQRQFQVCRAATLFHLTGPAEPGATVPQPVASALLDQINFIMSEAITRQAPANGAEGLQLLSFVESWILAFSRVLREEEASLADLQVREQVIFECIPLVWSIARMNIDTLMDWRSAGIDAPAPEDPVARTERQRALLRKFLGER